MYNYFYNGILDFNLSTNNSFLFSIGKSTKDKNLLKYFSKYKQSLLNTLRGFAGKLFHYSSYFLWLLFYLFKFFLFGGLLKPVSLSKFGGAMSGPSTPLPALLTGSSFLSNSFGSLVANVGISVFGLSAKWNQFWWLNLLFFYTLICQIVTVQFHT